MAGSILLEDRALADRLPLRAVGRANPGIRKSVTLWPFWILEASQRGMRPRPDQVSRLYSGSRYLAATLPVLRRAGFPAGCGRFDGFIAKEFFEGISRFRRGGFQHTPHRAGRTAVGNQLLPLFSGNHQGAQLPQAERFNIDRHAGKVYCRAAPVKAACPRVDTGFTAGGLRSPSSAIPEDIPVSTSSHSLAYLLARILLMALFLVSGLGKLGDLSGTQAYMEAMGVPGILLWPTVAFEIGSGLCILLGFQTRLVSIVLVGFSLVTALIFHHNFADQTQQIMFLKNLGLAGGFLLLACTGAGATASTGAVGAGKPRFEVCTRWRRSSASGASVWITLPCASRNSMAP